MSNSLPAHLLLCLRVFAAHYRQAPLQAGAILLGIVLAVTLLTGVRAVNENAKNSYNVTSEQFNQVALWQVVPKTGIKYLPEQIYFQIRNLGHNRSLAVLEGKVISESGQRWSLQGSDLTAALTAINTSQDTEDDSSLFSQPLPLAEMLAGEPYVLMAENQSDRLATNGSLTISNQRLNVVTLNDDFPLGSRLLTDISLAQKLLSAEGKISYVALFDELTLEQLNQLKQLSPDIRLVQSDKGESLSALTDSFHLNLTAMSLLAFIVGLFISYNGVRYSLLKRQRLFTQLRQLGMLKLPLLLALCIELSALVAAGSVAGFAFGLQLSHWLHPMVSTTLEQLYDANILATGWRWSWLLQSIALTLAASILACSSLFYQLLRQPLARSLGQFQIQQNAATVHKVQFITALILLLVAGVLFPLTNNYKVTMVLLGLVVIAIPLFLPVALSFLVRQLQKLPFSGLRGYLIAETKELLPPLSLAMMAILLAVTANVSMNTLVSSFEITLKQWLDARLHADLYIRPAQSEMDQVEQFLHQQPEISSVYKQYYVKSEQQNLPIYLVTKDNKTLEETTLFRASSDNVWQDFYSEKALIISEPMAVRLNLAVGDNIELEAIKDRQFTIGGIFYDYGNPYGEVLLPPQLWQQYGFTDTPSSLGVSTVSTPDQLREKLNQTLNLPDNLMYDQAEIKQRAISIFSKTFAITTVLNSLTLLVAAIGLFSSCFMLTQARAAPIARLYSLGVSRKQLTIMVISQMLGIVLLTCLVALPFGAILGYLLINHVTLQAFGWTIAMQWNWLNYVEVIATALVASFLAVGIPLYRQTRRPIMSSLQSEL